MHTLAFLCQALLLLVLWGMFAKMFHINEMRRAEDERIGDQETIQMLSLIWPLWAFSIWVAFAVRLLYYVGLAVYRIAAKVRYHLALLRYHHRRKRQSHVRVPDRTAHPARRHRQEGSALRTA